MSVTLNQAKFGTGVYGTAKYGQFIVDINLGVTATGAIGSVEPKVKVTVGGAISTGVTSRLISVAAADEDFYTERTADISAYIGATARLVVLYQSGSSFRGDVQLDDFNIGGNTFTDFSSSQGFQTNNAQDNSQVSSGSLDSIQSELDNVTFESVGTNTSAFGKWVRDSGGTPSGSTGLTSGKTGSFYLYAETSSTGSNNDIWLRSPSVTINNGTLSFFSAQSGSNCGPFFAYLDVSAAPVGLSASVSIGTVSVTVAPTISATPVTASFAISTTTNVDVQEDPSSGATATFAIASVDVAIQEDVGSVSASTAISTSTQADISTNTVTGLSATFNIATVDIGNINAPTSGVSGSINTPNLEVDIKTNTLTGVSASTAIGTAQAISNDATVDLTGVSATGSFAITAAGTKLNSPELTAVIASFVAPSAQADIQQDAFSVSATGTIASVEHKVAVGISGISASGTIGTVSPDINVENISGVSATLAIGDTLVARGATVPMTAVTASFAVGSVGVDNALDTVTAVTATGTVDSVQVDLSTDTATGVTATGAIAGLTLNITEVMEAVTATGAIGTVEAQPSENTESATASIVVGSLTQVKVSERLQAVTASGAINTSTQVKTSAGLDTVEAQGTIASVGVAVDSPTLTTILSSFSVASIAPDISEITDTVSATGVIGTASATGVQFDFEAVKELYDRFRTVYVEGFTQTSSERTVYVPTELRKIYVEGFSTSAERRARVSKAA